MKEIKITPPEGYEVDQENSTFELIKFKPIKPIKRKLSYTDITNEVFKDDIVWYIERNGNIVSTFISPTSTNRLDPNNCTSEKQAQKLMAINQLMNVAKYLNGAWKPNWGGNEAKWYIEVEVENSSIEVDFCTSFNSRVCYFQFRKCAEQAIEILGEDTIRLALSTDW